MRSNLGKKALFSAFLFGCTFSSTRLDADDCRLPGMPEQAEIASVLDGDTVRLADNRRVRLLAFGTLEVDHDHPEHSSALALEARKTLQYLLPKGSRVQLLTDREKYDSYGRTLAQLLRSDERDVAQLLLERGLAHVYLFPPNDRLWPCYDRYEQTARRAGLGLWALPEFQPRPLRTLQATASHYGLVRGIVTGYRKRSGAITVILDERLHVRIRADHVGYFVAPFRLPGIGAELTVRGQLNWRDGKAFLDLRHPQGLDARPEVISVD